MPCRALVLVLAAGLCLAAQPVKGGAGDAEEVKAPSTASNGASDACLTARSESLNLVIDRDTYALFDPARQLLVDWREGGPLALSDGRSLWEVARKSSTDDGAFWRHLQDGDLWRAFREGLDPADLTELRRQVEGQVAKATLQGDRPDWAAMAGRALEDLGWMARGVGKRSAPPQAERKDPGPVLHAEIHALGSASLRLTLDTQGLGRANATLALGQGVYRLQKVLEGRAYRTRVRFTSGKGSEVRFQGLGPWALSPSRTYPDLLKAASGHYGAGDLEAGRALVAKLLADGTRAPLLRNPLLTCVLADLDALAALGEAAPAPPPQGGSGPTSIFQAFKVGRLTLGIDPGGYALVDGKKLLDVERTLAGSLEVSGPRGRWTFPKAEGVEEAAFWRDLLAGKAGEAIREAEASETLLTLRADVGQKLEASRARTPEPAWVPAARMAWADLGRMGQLEAKAVRAEPKPSDLPSPVAAAVPVLTSPVAAAVPVLTSPVAAPVLEEKTPVERAVTWSAESRLGYRIEVRPSGYDLRLGGLRLVFALGGSGRDAWVTFTVSDGKGHAYTRTRTFHARSPRASKDVLGALAEEHYDAFELQPLIEAWREGGEDWMRPHAGLRALDDLESVLLDRLEATAAVEPRPADLAATFLATMEVSRFVQHVIEALAGPVD